MNLTQTQTRNIYITAIVLIGAVLTLILLV